MSSGPSYIECNRKAAVFTSEATANAEVRATETRLDRPFGSMQAYYCERCGKWKIGTNRAWRQRVHSLRYGPFDLTLYLELGSRAYGHGRFENGHPPAFMDWLTVRVPALVEKRRKQLAA